LTGLGGLRPELGDRSRHCRRSGQAWPGWAAAIRWCGRSAGRDWHATDDPTLHLRESGYRRIHHARARAYFDRGALRSSGCQRDNSSALVITLTELMAMAAPASIGLSRPNAASGMPTAL